MLKETLQFKLLCGIVTQKEPLTKEVLFSVFVKNLRLLYHQKNVGSEEVSKKSFASQTKLFATNIAMLSR